MSTIDLLEALPVARALAMRDGHAYHIVRESDGVRLATVLPPRDAEGRIAAAAFGPQCWIPSRLRLRPMR